MRKIMLKNEGMFEGPWGKVPSLDILIPFKSDSGRIEHQALSAILWRSAILLVPF